jgi:hypothetical protein
MKDLNLACQQMKVNPTNTAGIQGKRSESTSKGDLEIKLPDIRIVPG